VVIANKAERIAIAVMSTRNNLPDMEEDMYLSEWFRTKVREHKYYAQNLYAALCNNNFQKLEVVPILKEQTWSCSWRSAGGIVARIIGEGDYMDWYCSGIQDFSSDEADPRFSGGKYVPEGIVTDEIRKDLQKLGWVVVNLD
jgi:hypothetical protein